MTRIRSEYMKINGIKPLSASRFLLFYLVFVSYLSRIYEFSSRCCAPGLALLYSQSVSED